MSPLCRNFMQITYSQLLMAALRVSVLNPKLEVEKLDRIYVCVKCRSVFLFKSDVEDHREMLGHGDMKVQPFR